MIQPIYNRISIPTMEGFSVVSLDSLLYIEADGAYSHIHLKDKKIISAKNLGYYEKELLGLPFLRIHKSYIINMMKVTKYIKGVEGYVVLENKKILKVSKTKKEQLCGFFQRHSKWFYGLK